MAGRSYSWNAFEIGLNGPVTATADTILLDSTLGLRAPGYLVLEPESPTHREYIWFGSLNGSALENVSRGLSGSIVGVPPTSGIDHESGVKIRATSMHQMYDDIWEAIVAGDLDLSQHIADPGDPHAAAGYVTEAEADATYLKLSGGELSGILTLSYPSSQSLRWVRGMAMWSMGITETGGFYVREDGTVKFRVLPGGEVELFGYLDAQGNPIKNVGDPTSGGQAMSRDYADARYPNLTNGIMDGNLNMGGHKVTNLQNPNLDDDAMSRGYADVRYLHLGDTGLQTLQGDIETEDIRPRVDNTFDLGSAALSWDRVFVDALHDGSGALVHDLGSNIIYKNLRLDGHQIREVGDATQAGDAISRGYADARYVMA